jgi:UDP-glucose 4-epimerase
MTDFKNLNDKIITITGGTGSFGKTVLKSLAQTNVKKIRVLSRDETKQYLLRNELKNPKIEFYIGDVRDKTTLYDSFDGSDFIFHAAALKQVPSCEFNVFEAVKTNVIGSENVINVSQECNVKKTLMLSTDKAAMPINAMGMTKALMEKLAIGRGLASHIRGNTIFIITRYGNVMGSRGSVIPVFIEQLLNNKPLTVTDLRMTRFMMSLDESLNLVLYALLKGNQGELFVQKAPSATIETLIKSLEIIFNRKAKIKEIGWRHSEKRHETLLTGEEASRSTDLGEYYCVRPDIRDLNYDVNPQDISLFGQEEFNSANTKILKVEELADLLLKQSFMKEYL